MKVLMKILNEEMEIGRCVADFHDEPWVDDIVVIDGGSTDYTVHEVNHFDKVKCYVHPYLDWYHDAEITQANIMMSYANDGEVCLLVDADERLSDGLKDYLMDLFEKGRNPPADLVFQGGRLKFYDTKIVLSASMEKMVGLLNLIG